VHWFLSGEKDPAFQLQLNQMLTEQAFIGGQDYNAAREGRYEVNTQGSLADFQVAAIDELDKGNPATLAALLSLLNERKIQAGNKVIPSKNETIIVTGNATLPEMLRIFQENGLGSTAPALLNRFHSKAMVYNWLPEADQAFLDTQQKRRTYLQSLSDQNPQVRTDQLFLDPSPLPWNQMRFLARQLFKTSSLFDAAARELIEKMRTDTHRAIRESEERFRTNPQDEEYVYTAPAEFTERLRQQIPDIVLMSAFIDFLSSPLADDQALQQSTQRPIELDPASLWRAHLALTTLGLGHAKLKYDPMAATPDSPLSIHFGLEIASKTAKDRREMKMLEVQRAEWDRFNTVFKAVTGKIRHQLMLAAQHSAPTVPSSAQTERSFEVRIMPSPTQ
jgi:hypothetical protein